jgi:hypothetical protein
MHNSGVSRISSSSTSTMPTRGVGSPSFVASLVPGNSFQNPPMLRIVLEPHRVVVLFASFIHAAHQMRLRAPTHPVYLLDGSQHGVLP